MAHYREITKKVWNELNFHAQRQLRMIWMHEPVGLRQDSLTQGLRKCCIPISHSVPMANTVAKYLVSVCQNRRMRNGHDPPAPNYKPTTAQAIYIASSSVFFLCRG
ncbi:hypothetical protein M0R45_033566 [Rubus argutus]|uniref:Uncharacterized protein n=1 Tax=Rubus argutus TaxID=59490 RepID=A0AAW1WKN6_RUBAR